MIEMFNVKAFNKTLISSSIPFTTLRKQALDRCFMSDPKTLFFDFNLISLIDNN